MYKGQTPKKDKAQQQRIVALERSSLGDDFVAKLKSNRRHEFNGEWRKAQGQGEASLRRFTKAKSEGLKTRIK